MQRRVNSVVQELSRAIWWMFALVMSDEGTQDT